MGHLSLVLTLPAYGTIILAADAISRPDELADDRYADAEDQRAARQSAHMLRQRAQHDAAWLVYGHCPQQWQSMRRAPYWYT
jgi:N-acyl homoserine lactone hydrolase